MDFQKVALAAQTGKCVKFLYPREGGGPLKLRTVEPYSYRVVNGKNFLFAWDVDDGTMKQWDVTKVQSVRIAVKSSQMRFSIEI